MQPDSLPRLSYQEQTAQIPNSCISECKFWSQVLALSYQQHKWYSDSTVIAHSLRVVVSGGPSSLSQPQLGNHAELFVLQDNHISWLTRPPETSFQFTTQQ